MKLKSLILILVAFVFVQSMSGQVIFQYGSNYVCNPNGNGMSNLRAGTAFGIVNVMFTNVASSGGGTAVSALAIIETNDGQSFSIQGTIFGRNNGNPISTFFWSPNPGNSLSLNIAGSTPLLLTNSGSVVGDAGVPPATGGTFNGLAVVQVGSNIVYSAGANVSGNSGNILSEFQAYESSIPKVTTNSQSSFTNTVVNGWGGVSTFPAGTTIADVGIHYSTSAGVTSGGTTSSTPVGTKISMFSSPYVSNSNFSANTTGLAAATTYYYRAYVVVGTTYYQGLLKSFTTCANTPTPTVSSPQSFCSSSSPTIASIVASTNVSGGSLNWYAASSGGTALPTSQSLSVGSTTYYVSQTACVSVESSRVAVTANVFAPSVAGTISVSGGITSVCSGNTKTLILSGNTGSIQWQESSNNSSFSNVVSGGTSASYTTSALTATRYFRAVVTNGTCSSATSSSQMITIEQPVAITSQSTSTQAVCQNTSPTPFSVTATGLNLSYQWYSNSTSSNTGGTLINGATLATYSPPTASLGDMYYYCIVTGGAACTTTATSNVSGVVQVGEPPVLGTVTSPANPNTCNGDSKDFSLSGNNGNVQWELSSTSNGTFSNSPSPNANQNAFNTGSLGSTTFFRVKVSNAYCSVYSDPVEIIVNTPVFNFNSNYGDWNTASNWNRSCDNGNNYSPSNTTPTVPSISKIDNGKEAYACNLNNYAGNSIIVKTGGKLRINRCTDQGVLTNNGTIELEPDACLVQEEGSTTAGSGTYTVKRNMSGSGGSTPNGRMWYFGVPLGELGTSASYSQSSSVNAAGDNKLWIYHENPAGNTPVGQGYQEITNNTTGLALGRGHVFRGGSDATYSFSSTKIGNGNVPIGLTRSNSTAKPGFNLIANPYPSHLDWKTFYESTLVGGVSPILPSCWYRTHGGSGNNVMLFNCYNAALNIGTSNTCNCDPGTANDNFRYVAPFQAFWVRVKEGNSSATITAKNSMRSCGSQAFMTVAPAIVRLNFSNGSISDETIVVLKEDVNNAYDEMDSEKEIASTTIPQMYSLEGTKRVVINGIGNALAKDSLQLGVQVPIAGSYTINCSEFTFSDLVYLEDKLTNAYIELTNATVYNFTSAAGTFNNRFVLHFAPNVPGASAGNAIAMPTSNWPTCNNVTSSDSWHSFNATSEGVSIEVTSTVTNVTVLLQDAFGNIVAEENAVAGPGVEKLNFYGLVAGNVYKVGVRNFIGNQNVGVYTICVKSLKRGGCDYGAGPYSLCQYYKATWAGSTGVSYTFTFTGTSGPAAGQTFTRTQNSDICVLSTVTPLLPYGSTYDVVISNTYTLTDGAGNTEQITVPSINGCQVITIAEPQTALSNSSSCNNGARFRGAVVSSMPWVCGSNNWRWRFTEVNPLTMQTVGLPIELNRGSASNYLSLGTVSQLQNGKTYAVQTAPIFNYTGTNYNWGPVQYMCIVGAAGMTLEGADAEQGVAQGSTKDVAQDASQDLNAMVYVTEGNLLNVQLTHLESVDAVYAEIFDVTGKRVMSTRLVQGNNHVKLTGSAGIYMVRIVTGNQSETHRVFIKN